MLAPVGRTRQARPDMKECPSVPRAKPARRPCVVVADDSTVAREGIAAIIRGDLRYPVCGLAKDQKSTNELLEQHQHDALLIEPFFGQS